MKKSGKLGLYLPFFLGMLISDSSERFIDFNLDLIFLPICLIAISYFTYDFFFNKKKLFTQMKISKEDVIEFLLFALVSVIVIDWFWTGFDYFFS